MIHTALYWIGAAVALACATAGVSLLLWLVGRLLLAAGTYLLRRGLQCIRLCNWLYWNERMSREGLISMQTFYRAQVTKHKPKTLDEFNELDAAARRREQGERAATAETGARPADPMEKELRAKALWRESDGEPLNKAAHDLLKHWGETA